MLQDDEKHDDEDPDANKDDDTAQEEHQEAEDSNSLVQPKPGAKPASGKPPAGKAAVDAEKEDAYPVKTDEEIKKMKNLFEFSQRKESAQK